ncbi:MAG: DUF1192 family protein [Alphaproteobacteria bacterium]|jgi:uncharacterized small protein (DUF1192 family)|tara:strand:- start:206 stop:388 length:183 start_codon:yes stop_codon:yes gene_type:complete
MSNFIEFDENTKAIKSISLEDFSVEDLEEYILNLVNEQERAKEEIKKRLKTKEEAQKFFK